MPDFAPRLGPCLLLLLLLRRILLVHSTVMGGDSIP